MAPSPITYEGEKNLYHTSSVSTTTSLPPPSLPLLHRCFGTGVSCGLFSFFIYFVSSLKLVCIGNVSRSVEPSGRNVEHPRPTVTFSPDLTVTPATDLLPQSFCRHGNRDINSMPAVRFCSRRERNEKRKWRINRAYGGGRVRKQSGGGRKGGRFSWCLWIPMLHRCVLPGQLQHVGLPAGL